MEVRIYKELYEKVGQKNFVPFILTEESFSWNKHVSVDLVPYGPKQLHQLLDLVTPHQDIRGTRRLISDITTWIAVVENKGTFKPRTVQHFSSILIKFIGEIPTHHLYYKNKSRDVWECYYVESVEYHPPKLSRDGYGRTPPHVDMEVFWVELGGMQKETEVFHAEDCIGMTVSQSLAQKGFAPDTKELREQYLKEKEKFNAWCPKIGMQFFATGSATDDLDGNADKDEDRWWRRSVNTLILDKDGEASRVVIDVFRETDKESRDKELHIDKWFWEQNKVGQKKREKDEDQETEVDLESEPKVEIPLHPLLACFDLKRHLRLRIHVEQLTEYIYDPKLGEKLVLPEDSRALVEILLAHKGGFKDIIAGKGGGAVILCAGPPGTGKTLTAEIYAEVTARPLYTVQCSQLGITAEDLEDELLKVFVRSQRWNAILLLDEADVYVASRGHDLIQNAIVGVFLRTLEYYKGVLFLTTNRADLVDDAVASRCVAKIEYRIPLANDQKKIWRILADVAEVELSDSTIDLIVFNHSKLSGRDIKNLLKLAVLVSRSRGDKITYELINFVKKFKPTQTEKEKV